MKRFIRFDMLESRVVLSDMTGMEVALAPEPIIPPLESEFSPMPTIEVQILNHLTEEQERLWDQVATLRQEAMNEAFAQMAEEEARRKAAIAEALQPWAPAAYEVEPSYWESFLNALDAALKAATESGTPYMYVN